MVIRLLPRDVRARMVSFSRHLMINLQMDPDRDIARSSTLAAPRYFTQETFDEEKNRIFSSTWQLAGHAHQVANPGDYFTFDLIGEPLMAVRGDDGMLRAFYNGWTYRLDGALLVTPEFDGVEHFDPREHGLAPVQVEEWFNMVFVNLDPGAAPLAEFLGELPTQAEKFDFRRMKFSERRTYDMKCNWKTYVDNYLEGYHLPSVHPALNRELNYTSYTVETYRQHVRQWSPIRGAEPGDNTPRRYQQARDDLTADYFWIFPNWMLNCYPDNVSLNMILPLEPERTLAIFEWYVPEEDLDSEAARKSVNFSDEVQMEALAICEIVQKNLHSRSYHSGRYSVKQEKGVHAFHRMYRELMPGS